MDEQKIPISKNRFFLGLLLPGFPIFGGIYVGSVYSPLGYIISVAGFLFLTGILILSSPGRERNRL